jgi:hypothetical protein
VISAGPSRTATITRFQLERQVNHWVLASASLNLDDLASPEAWKRLELYLGLSLRQHLSGVIERLQRQVNVLKAMLDAAESPLALEGVKRQLLNFRQSFMRTETTLDFFADAINTRTNARQAQLLQACDTLAMKSMNQLLDQLGKPTPTVLTYLDKGLGASILKAGLRLWDGGKESPCAAIKIVRHNMLRPTALIHEAGHQVAHIVGWNQELATILENGLQSVHPSVARTWSSWSSEIAADAFAFVHTGYASVAALHDVLAGEKNFVLQFVPGDPHPTSYIRVLLGVEMCRYFYGAGPWDDLAETWLARNPLDEANPNTARLMQLSISALPQIVKLTLDTPMRSFAGRPLRALIQPERVSPKNLLEMEVNLGKALFTSAHWIWTEALRLLALTGLKIAMQPKNAKEILNQQEEWMRRLGGSLQAV